MTSKKQNNKNTTGDLANKLLGDNIISVETFRNPKGYTLNSLIKDKPSSLNGIVDVFKYKVSVELVHEPITNVHNRLQKLWDESENWHHLDPLKKMAKFLNYELKGGFGSKRKR